MSDTQDLSDRRNRLNPAQRAQLLQKLRGQVSAGADPVIPRAAAGQPLPLSFAQQRQWFLWKLDPTSAAYHLQGGLGFDGQLDVVALQASLQAIVDRHGSLRTIFREREDGVAEQVVIDHVAFDLPCIDLSALPREGLAARVRTEADRVCAAPFDLANAPLLRAVLFKLDATTHRLVVVMHHIVSDAWSTQLILDELAARYRDHVLGTAVALPALPIAYADYAVWQRDWLSQGEGERQLAWWAAKLGPEQPVLSLHTDHPRRPDGRYAAAEHLAELPAALLGPLRGQVRERGATLFMALLAAFHAMLFRYSGQPVVRVGVPIANRNRTETAGVVGFFVNAQVLQVRVDPRMSLVSLLEQAGDAAIGGQMNQDLPFERLVEVLHPERSLSVNPMFQALFNHLRRDHRSLSGWPGVAVTRLDFEDPGAQFELTLETREYDDGRVEARFSYARELFDKATIERMAGHYTALLHAMATRPDVAVGEVALLSDAEWHQLAGWGVNAHQHPDAQPVHRLVEAEARRRPDAPALVFGDEQLTYAEFNRRANRLAHVLMARGVGPEVRVGIAADRSIEMMVGLLAILKAGGAYVPLDPEYPADRLGYIVQDSAISLLLAQRHLVDKVPRPAGLPVMRLDEPDLSNGPDHDPCVALDLDNLAYVIYTSGSTGRPKGAANRHGALFNCMRWMQASYALGRDETVLHKAPFGFDVSVWEMFWPLTVGARLALAGPGDHRDLDRIVALIHQHGVTTMNFVPVMLRAFLQHDGVDRCTHLRRIVCGGEAMSAEAQREIAERLPNATLYNLYGPTEAAIHITHWTCRPDNRTQVPIGRPIDGCSTWVLDAELNPVPAGVAGELFLGGEGLGRGYLGRPDLTAERFVAAPFGDAGLRLYRTGDLVRWNREGQLDYLGRIDHQVKVRGFRIELGEVEGQLLAQSGVREAVVVAREGANGTRLLAYATAQVGRVLDAADVREQLRRTLPDYMVPSAVVLMVAMPVNANGKIDRQALPEPELSGEREYEPPVGDAEEAIGAVWSDVLNVPRIGRHDNFFELGGDSIVSLQIVAQLRHRGWKVTPRQLFELQTVHHLAEAAVRIGLADTPDVQIGHDVPLVHLTDAQRAALPFADDDIEDILPLTPMQQGMLLHTLLDPGSGMYLMQDRCTIRSHLDLAMLWESWDEVIQDHAAFRASFVWQGSETPFQMIHRRVDLPKDYIDLRHLPRSEGIARLDRILEDELATGFDLHRAPLMHIRLAHLADGELQLVVSFHHMLMDAWCYGLMMSDVLAAYDTRVSGVRVSRERPAPYREFMAWLARQDRNAARAHWQQVLAGLDGVTPLPMRRPVPPGGGGSRMIDVTTVLSAEQTRRLAAMAQRHQVTPNTVAQGAWALTLARHADVHDVLFGVTVAGRPVDMPHLQRTLGLFINTVPLRVALPGPGDTTTVAEWLRALLAQNLRSREFEHLPLVEAQELSGLPHDTPMFDSLFVFENAPVESTLIERAQASEAGQNSSRTHTNYPLTVVVLPRAELALQITYDERCFDAASIDRLLGSLRRVVEAFIEQPGASLGDIEVLSSAGKDTLLALGCGPLKAYPFERGYIDLFRDQVAAHRDRVAARCLDRMVRYGELDAASDRLAWLLREAGAGRGDVIVVFAERGLGLLEMVLACFKVGAAYLAVDIDTPPARLARIVSSSGARVVVSDVSELPRLDAVLSVLPDGAGLPRVVIASQGRSATDRPFPASAFHPDQPAYVIFTSGSTGEPKGVVVTSRGMLNNQLAKVHGFPLGPDDVVAQTASQSFDISVWQLLGALLCGGRVDIVPNDLVRDPLALVDHLRDHQVTVLECVPSLMQHMVAGGHAALPRLRVTMATGEAIHPSLVRDWQRWHPEGVLINAYGPAECADDVSLHVAGPWSGLVAEGHVAEARGVYPIGKPVDNLRLRVLDARMAVVPVGACGELYVSGAGVGMGYLGRAALTAERFVADPFEPAGGRLYRTGDLVRWNGDGELEYLGRVDHQVKVRGFRIELGDIEAQLLQHADVRDAVVVARSGHGGDRLIAYVVPRPGRPLDEAAMRSALARALPDYMVPAAVVVLAALPLNPNGKVDRKALPAPVFDGRDTHEAPQGELEVLLAAIWADVLGVAQVGRQDNFFELGGHSLMALVVLERLRARGWAAQVRTLFQHPRLAAFAQAVGDGPAAEVLAVPASGIPPGCPAIEPGMLPLVALDSAQIRLIEAGVPGGAPNIQDIYPLSPLQEGILFHHRLETQGDAYVIPTLLAFDSRARLEGFVAALNEVVARHDVLRTAVVWEGLEAPVQVVYRRAEATLTWPGIDASASVDVAAQLMALVHPARYRIDVRQAPMLRAIAAHDVSLGRWLLQLPAHHLVLDHATLEHFVEEITLIQQGRHAELPVSVPYRNFVHRARHGIAAAAHEQFFREMLGDVDEPTTPFGLADVQGNGTTVEEHRRPVDGLLATRVRQQAKRHGVSPATLFHVAWSLVLRQATGKDDVVFGSVLFGRMASGADGLRALGLFINTLPVRVQLGARSVAQCVAATHDMLSGLLQHEHASLSLAQRCSALTGGTPLFSSLLNYRYTPRAPRALAWDGIEVVSAAERTNFPVAMTVDDLGDGFELVAQVVPSVGAERLNDWLLQSVDALVEGLDTVPEQPIRELALTPDSESRQIASWSVNARQYAETEPVHRLIERQARHTPDAVALVCGASSLTYRALNARANRLAHHLIARGVVPETRVGVAAERSVEMVVALLAVLKSGGAYVPLDPDLPQDRLSYMVEDSRIELLLVQRHLAERLPVAGRCAQFVLEDLSSLGAGDRDPMVRIHPENAAYVIYTSGSTGRPKGATNRHGALHNRLVWMQEAYFLDGTDAVLQKTPFSFDVSVWEFFWPLMTGARLVMAGPAEHREPARLVALIREHTITTLHFVPSMLQAFLGHAGIEQCDSLRRLVCSGEALPADVQNRVFARLPSVQLFNLYGPTEAAIDVTHWTCVPDGQGHVPIGRPISATQAWVLDADLGQSPIGVAGELYLGGAGLARGYLGRTALTAERFVAHPFDPAGGRLYRTGDVVRWRPDGQLAYLGRVDHQVKVRGFRIELGEIEAQLLALDAVREAVVVARAGPDGPVLVAYVSLHEGHVFDGSTLRAALGRVLPDHMVPGTIVPLARLPLNASGKVDRKALPEPSSLSSRHHVIPEGEVEQQVARLWSEVLGVDPVGRLDNFFELGGHSLLALRVLDGLRSLGWPAEVRSLFQHPVLSDFARTLVSVPARAAVIVPPPAIPEGCRDIEPGMLPLVTLDAAEIAHIVSHVPGGAANVQDIYPLAPLQEGILFHHRLDTQGDAYITSNLLAFDTRRRLEDFIAAFNEVIDRHDILRTSVVWDGLEEAVQVVHRRAPLVLEWLDGAERVVSEGRAADRLAALVDPSSFRIDVQRAPMVRAMAVHDPDSNRWLLQMPSHHLVLDHTTMDHIVEEIRWIQQGRGSELPVSVPFRQYVGQARLGVPVEEHEDFFRAMLGDVDEPTAPFDLLDVQGSGNGLVSHRQELPEALSTGLRREARRLGVSAATLFHVGWALVVSATSGKDDVVFGTVLFGRMGGQGAERALGLFINTLPLRVRLGSQEVLACVRRTHELLTGLLHHEHASLSLAQRCSALPGGAPLFSALLNYRYSARDPSDASSAWDGMEVLEGTDRTNYPVMMSVDDLGDGFAVTAQVLPSAGAERLCGHVLEALAGLVDALGRGGRQPVCTLGILGQAERAQLDRWGHRTDYPGDEPVHRRVERTARERPGAAALAVGDTTWTYEVLNARANRLAHRLIRLGVTPETRVGLAVPRSADSVVGLLAILKAGGVYVPFDLSHPAERFDHMVHDSGIALMLTHSSLRKTVGTGGVTAVPLDQLDLQAEAAHDPSVTRHADQLAYVLYTSGSTGRPKGTAMSHRVVSQLMAWQASRLPGERRTLMFASPCFDVGFQEVFSGLGSGGGLVQTAEDERHDFALLLERVSQQSVARIFLPFAVLQLFAESALALGVRLPHLREVVTAGEQLKLTVALVDWLKREPQCRLVNQYGPTESHVVSDHVVTDPDGPELPPIGVPASSARLRVLDSRLRAVPVGVAGELFIGSTVLARGYVGQSGLTAERFVADPFDPDGSRLYRSGDLVRWQPDGELVYLGRTDHQVKVRGFRVEPGEIEAVLMAQPEVREAVVVPLRHAAGTRLVAYVSPRPGAAIDVERLRDALARVLPEHAVPSTIVALASLPLNPNGKVDRRALPVPAWDGDRPHAPPEGDLETALAALWGEVLGAERVGRHDDFFELGGHSLAALQIVSLLAQRHDCRLAVRHLFEARTVATLATRLPTDTWREASGTSQRLSQLDDLLSEFET